MTQRTRADSPTKVCTEPECDRPLRAKGMCAYHYNSKVNPPKKATPVECPICGTVTMKRDKSRRFCSLSCRDVWRRHPANRLTRCPIPPDHPSMVLMRQMDEERERAKEAQRQARDVERRGKLYAWRTTRQCPGCACRFTPLYAPNAVCCSRRCAKRISRQRRRAREHGARGEFTWSEFMRIARRFDYCCAYCGEKPERLDPDHVVPLSRGGTNTPSNLLPCCLMCNSSKNAMTLSEWAAWLAERGLPARRTTWTPSDARYVHLTDALLTTAA